jgi:Fur family ferric uptake transcriptional regulator
MERNTRQRAAVLAAIEAAGRPLLPQEVLAEAGAATPSLGMATVYRTLKALSEAGRVKAVALAGEPVRYEAAGHGHHHHFQCRECKRVFDVPGCVGDLAPLVPKGFQLADHEVLLFGRCDRCVAPPLAKTAVSPRAADAGAAPRPRT